VVGNDFEVLRLREFKLKTDYKTDRGDDPDADHLNTQIEARNKWVLSTLNSETRSDRMKVADIKTNAKLRGIDTESINRMVIEEETRSRDALLQAQTEVSEPTFDIEAVHEKEMELNKRVEGELTSSGNPYAQGYLYNPSYAGYWRSWNGETEERPRYQYWSGPRNMDVRAQAYGEGWYDSDYSKIHGYLAYRLTPPFYGILRISVSPWIHAWWSLYSNDTWYSSKSAYASISTWIDLHQHWWRSRQYIRRFSRGGDEIHPADRGRIDASCYHVYETNVAHSDTVTIRIGVEAFGKAKGGGSHAVMDVLSGAGNYFYVPLVHWYLYR
jgi:hypothetical protein